MAAGRRSSARKFLPGYYGPAKNGRYQWGRWNKSSMTLSSSWWILRNASAEACEKYGKYITKELTESFERTRVGLKGPVTTPIGGGFASINVQLRKQFELYSNFRPVKSLPSLPTRFPNVDLVIVRENTE